MQVASFFAWEHEIMLGADWVRAGSAYFPPGKPIGRTGCTCIFQKYPDAFHLLDAKDSGGEIASDIYPNK